MKVKYDLHIHSGLSPCAENDMSPINILAMSSVQGLNMIAISDHNAIDNVKVTVELGNLLHITVVPAIELQTSEDIHMLCLFKKVEDLENFFKEVKLQQVVNNEQIFGEQIIYDEDGKDISHLENLLLVASNIPSYKIKSIIQKYDGVAIPAHIDRESNSMLNILGNVDEEFRVVEISSSASQEFINKYSNRLELFNSDAHTLVDIGKQEGTLNLRKNTAECLVEYLKHYE